MCDSLAQSGKFEQGFTVIAFCREAHVQPVIPEDLRGRRADAEPLHTGRCWPIPLEQFDADPGGRLADHDDGAELIQRQNHLAHCVSGLNGHDVQKRQTVTEYPLLGQKTAQRRRFFGGTRQQQAPADHS
ncbi:hypothetical protein D9M71_595690 [compost metagenome]